jgi:hypothetical protein
MLGAATPARGASHCGVPCGPKGKRNIWQAKVRIGCKHHPDCKKWNATGARNDVKNWSVGRFIAAGVA